MYILTVIGFISQLSHRLGAPHCWNITGRYDYVNQLTSCVSFKCCRSLSDSQRANGRSSGNLAVYKAANFHSYVELQGVYISNYIWLVVWNIWIIPNNYMQLPSGSQEWLAGKSLNHGWRFNSSQDFLHRTMADFQP